MNYLSFLHSPVIPSKIVSLIEKASQNDLPILILGEQGTGKELIAKIIHHTGGRKGQPFHTLDCRFLSEESFGEQLSRSLKKVDEGSLPGTVYLKEISSLDKGSQLKLLRFMEEEIFLEKGDGDIARNPRFISSSSEDLEATVAKGRFSEDLYDRLITFSIKVPSLRDRTEEISALAHYLLIQYSAKMRLKKVEISSSALKLLEGYWWPGNLKEFERVIVRSALFSEGASLTDQDLFLEIGNKASSLSSFRNQAKSTPTALKSKGSSDEPKASPLPLFFIELVHRIKNPLVSIKTFTQLLREKFDDGEFREYFYRIVTEDIERIDEVLDGLLNYVKISTPIRKANTVHSILEEIFKRYEKEIEEKQIKIFKKFEKDLPETVLHDEHLRYILSSLFRYAIPSIPPAGSIGFLTRTYHGEQEIEEDRELPQRDGRWIEILMIYTGFKKWAEPFETVLGTASSEQKRAIELELRLVKEMIEKSRGAMRLEMNEKKARTTIFLRLPVERREVIYYPATSA
jgi:nitrogen-specific signal transduction histidine kinase